MQAYACGSRLLQTGKLPIHLAMKVTFTDKFVLLTDFSMMLAFEDGCALFVVLNTCLQNIQNMSTEKDLYLISSYCRFRHKADVASVREAQLATVADHLKHIGSSMCEDNLEGLDHRCQYQRRHASPSRFHGGHLRCHRINVSHGSPCPGSLNRFASRSVQIFRVCTLESPTLISSSRSLINQVYWKFHNGANPRPVEQET
jgi:hypothetical protein